MIPRGRSMILRGHSMIPRGYQYVLRPEKQLASADMVAFTVASIACSENPRFIILATKLSIPVRQRGERRPRRGT